MDQGFSKRLVPVPLSRKDYGKWMVIYMPVLNNDVQTGEACNAEQ